MAVNFYKRVAWLQTWLQIRRKTASGCNLAEGQHTTRAVLPCGSDNIPQRAPLRLNDCHFVFTSQTRCASPYRALLVPSYYYRSFRTGYIPPCDYKLNCSISIHRWNDS